MHDFVKDIGKNTFYVSQLRYQIFDMKLTSKIVKKVRVKTKH